ncbi:uncharacterized protein LOC115268387 [Aedes albopictus]|uniref:Secreted protein n=1 Tax=Aedes albopictus TaxID=7160 RepID=A0ABM1XYM4_AEDAL
MKTVSLTDIVEPNVDSAQDGGAVVTILDWYPALLLPLRGWFPSQLDLKETNRSLGRSTREKERGLPTTMYVLSSRQ